MEDGRTNWFMVMLVAVAVPLLGFWVGTSRVSSLNAESQAAIGLDMATVCELNQVIGVEGIGPFCGRLATANFLKVLSLSTLAVGLLLVFGYLGLAWWAGANRNRNAAVFPVAVPIALATVGLLTFAQVGIVLVALFALGFVGKLFVFIGIAGLLATVAVLQGLRALSHRPVQHEFAIQVTPEQAPALWSLVNSVADKVGATAPNNLIMGMQPTFYATSADVALAFGDRRLSGETLFLSMPLMRILRRDEVAAVIGHELGHFKGADVAYTRKFAPAFVGMGTAINSVNSLNDSFIQHIARLPALTFSHFLLSVFAVNERRIRRDREFEADVVGASASSPTALASALLKLTAYSGLWSQFKRLVVEGIRDGKPTRDLPYAFEFLARSASSELATTHLEGLLKQRTTHPLDTHPPTAERLNALGVQAENLALTLGDGLAAEVEMNIEMTQLGAVVTALELNYMQRMLSARSS